MEIEFEGANKTAIATLIQQHVLFAYNACTIGKQAIALDQQSDCWLSYYKWGTLGPECGQLQEGKFLVSQLRRQATVEVCTTFCV